MRSAFEDLDAVQLSAGGGLGALTALVLPHGVVVEMERVPFDLIVRTVSRGPTLLMPLANPRWGTLNGEPLLDGPLLSPSGSEMLGTLPAWTSLAVIRLDQQHLEATSAELGWETGLSRSGAPIRVEDPDKELCGLMAELGGALVEAGELPASTSLEMEIIEAVARGLAGRHGACDALGPNRGRSFSIVADADDLAATYGWRGISVSEVCGALELSETRLRRAFQDIFHCSPKRFLTVRALNAARSALMDARPSDTTVSDIAAEFGFWHFGRFARDYRSVFGELPSATLRSGQRGVAPGCGASVIHRSPVG